MRQGQQNRRGRGRNNNGGGGGGGSGGGGGGNNNRKGQNPLTRSFESNGPDMKIRGTPAHIAEKYISMARDAHLSGDPVLAENYLQHAEHYNRIILAYREQQISQGGSDPGGLARPRPMHDAMDGDDFGDENGNDFGDQPQLRADQQPQPQSQPRSYEERPRFEDRPHRQGGQEHRPFRDRGDRPDRGDRQDRGDRPDRAERQDRGDRPDRGDRQDRGGERQDRHMRPRHERPDRVERVDFNDRQPAAEAPGFIADRPQPAVERAPERVMPERVMQPQPPPEQPPHVIQEPAARAEAPRRRERFAQSTHEQPEFLRRPVRRPRREPAATAAEGEGGGPLPAAQPVGADEPSRD